MIWGRPTNLWLALVTATLAFAQVAIITLVPTVDPVQVATLLGSFGGFLAVVIALIANQPPTVAEGDTVKVAGPNGDPPVVSVPVYSTPTVNKGDVVTVLTPDDQPNEELVA